MLFSLNILRNDPSFVYLGLDPAPWVIDQYANGMGMQEIEQALPDEKFNGSILHLYSMYLDLKLDLHNFSGYLETTHLSFFYKMMLNPMRQ